MKRGVNSYLTRTVLSSCVTSSGRGQQLLPTVRLRSQAFYSGANVPTALTRRGVDAISLCCQAARGCFSHCSSCLVSFREPGLERVEIISQSVDVGLLFL